MAPSDRNAVLAIEWVWLLIGTGVVLAHLVEAWAAPYLPLIWMMVGLVVFLAYRFAAALRQIYFPKKPSKQPVGATLPSRTNKRAYEDDAPATAYVVLPHQRGRRRREGPKGPRKEPSGNEASDTQELLIDTDELEAPANESGHESGKKADQKIAVPSADGAFYDDDLATVLADVEDDASAEDNEETLRVDKDELRKETEADVTTSGISIPHFAESSLTPDERRQAMEAVHGFEEDPSRVETQPSVSVGESDGEEGDHEEGDHEEGDK